MKKLRLLLFLLLAPFLASATISITINSPYPGGGGGSGGLYVNVDIYSDHPPDTVKAIVGSRSLNLTMVNQYYYQYKGNLDLSGFTSGHYTLEIYVKDALGNTATKNQDFTYYALPVIKISAPTNNAFFSTSKIHIKASITTLPGTLNCRITVGNFAHNFFGFIDTLVDVLPDATSYSGAVFVSMPDYDSATPLPTLSNPIYIDKSIFLQPLFSDTGRVIDFRDTRALVAYADSNNIPHLKIVNTATNSTDVINLGSNITATTVANGVLTDQGAAVTLNYQNIYNTNKLFSWRSGTLTPVSNTYASSTDTAAYGGIISHGNYLLWPSYDDKLLLTNLTNLTTDTLATGATSLGYDFSPQGTIVYSTLNAPGQYTLKKYTISNATAQAIWNNWPCYYPAIDGNNIVYTYQGGQSFDIHLNNGVTDTIIGSSLVNKRKYKLSGGYISFTRVDNTKVEQIWTRSPTNVSKQRTFFTKNYVSPDAMSNDGRLLFSNSSGRYYADSLTQPTIVQSNLGKAYVVNDNFYVAMGGSVLKLDLSPVKLRSKFTSFSPATAKTGDTIIIKGGNFNTATAVTFGSMPAASYHIVSDSLITAVIGPGASGIVAITTSGGTQLLPGFTYLPQPIIDSVPKKIGRYGTTIAIFGSHFSGTTSVTFGGVPAKDFGVLKNGINMQVIVGAGASGDIVVTTPYGTARISGFTYLPSPVANASITLTPQTTLTATTGPGYQNLKGTVPYEVSSIKVTPSLNLATSTVTVNGTAVSSGTASQPIPLALGNNIIHVVVTAEDGLTAHDYILTVVRNGSSDASLANLSVSNVALSPVFAKTTTNYTATVPYATSSVTVTPTTSAATSTVKVNGAAVASGQASAAIPLAAGLNTITTTVTAENGTTQTYTVKITRAAANLSTNAVLSILALTPKTSLTVVSGPGYCNYTATVAADVSSVLVTPTAQDATASIRVNGALVASGTSSGATPLNIGTNTINVVVTAQDGGTIKNYIITVHRPAALSNLVLSTGTFNPVFAASTTSYTAVVPYATSYVIVTPTATDASATIEVNGGTVPSGTTSAAIPLAVGSNTITTTVRAYDGTGMQTYTINVTRAASNLSTNAVLSVLALTPKTSLTVVSGPGYRNYTASVAGSVSSVQVTPTAQDATATIKVNGTIVASGALSKAIALTLGANIINVVVTAQDGATVKNYIITVNRPATLSSLALSTGTLSPAFAPTTTVYSTKVPYASSSITVTPATTVANSTIKVNGVTVASGSVSTAIPLAVGANNISTTITTQDGAATLTYLTTVTRAAANLSTNAVLSVISLTPRTTLTNSTGPGYRNYTASVANGVSSVQVTPISQDANATIKVNGTTVVSGALSKPILLSVGSNVITTVVTAQDGATTKSYIITVTRAAAGMIAAYEPENVVTDGLKVHQGVSPNGDGSEDVLTIDGIEKYPDNTLQIMGRSGDLVYEARGYDNAAKVFDGHASATGKLQPAGTYFYSLEYKDGSETKRKTGFIVLKY